MTETPSWETFERKMSEECIVEARQLWGPHTSSRFEQMLDGLGFKEAVHRLLLRYNPPIGTLSIPHQIGRMDLTMEYWVASENFKALFTLEEIEVASWRIQNADKF